MSRMENKPIGPFWHGSHELISGDKILSSRDFLDSDTDLPVTSIGGDPNRAYFTTSLEYARAWVSQSHGFVYEIEPVGEVISDPDTPGIGFSADQYLKVERLADGPVSMSTTQVRLAFASPDMSRFDVEGIMRLDHPEIAWKAERGLTPELCSTFPRFGNPNRVLRNGATGLFEYVTDDFTVSLASYLWTLVTDLNMSESDVMQLLKDPGVVREVKASVDHRPICWL